MNRIPERIKVSLALSRKKPRKQGLRWSLVIEGEHERRKINRRNARRTLPFKFQVPTKHTHFLMVEYSDDLGRKNQHCYGYMYVVLPLLESFSDMVMDWIIYGDLRLTIQISLRIDSG